MEYLAPGLHNIEADRYHADPAERPSLSSGLARTLLAQSPRHAWVNSPRLNPHWQPKDSATFDVGRAAHRAILGRGGDWAVYPPEILGSNGAVSTKAAKEWEAETRARGITPLKADVEAQVLTMEARAREILAEHGITLSPLRSEIVAIAEIEGVLCRAMFDNVPEDPALPIYDFKTCEDASPDAVRRSIMNYGYDFQAEWYRQVWRAATEQDRRFCFIFQEKKEPNEIAVVELTGLDLELTADRCAFARDRWRRCLSANDWPGYVRETIRMELPEFYHAKRVEKMQMDRDAPSAAARRAAYDAQIPAAE